MPKKPTKHRLPLVAVAGQVPPPTGGQNIMIERILKELEGDARWHTVHWNFRFTPTFLNVRKARLSKLLELLRVIARAIALRWKFGRADLLLYPSGGPQTVPVIRDILLLPVAKWLARAVWVQFHAAGIADRLVERNGSIEKLLLLAYRGVKGAIVMAKFNRCDPAALGINTIEVIPHRIKDENPAAHLPDFSFWVNLTSKIQHPTFNILYAGHLYGQKGTPQLVEAFGKIASDFPWTKLVLMGEFLPPYTENQCRTRCAELGITDRVEITGVLRGKEKAAQFRAAHLFVFPTIAPYESFGLVMIEAMMWGLPIVATDWRGNRDVAGPDAWYCPAESPELPHLVATIRAALDKRDEFEEIGRRNRTRFLEKFACLPGVGNYREWTGRELVNSGF
jgi:glycosyltransferase involved in cell wall biosynthesis